MSTKKVLVVELSQSPAELIERTPMLPCAIASIFMPHPPIHYVET